ncbi:MAG: sigma-70 family RNA polymerase sigma factor [Anaerolineae bacterium]|nr:sigma-70 family RNA polymerase sigma factor [Anaerolineae bacterium]
MANAPDEKLVRRAQKGDKAAFAELFTRYEGRIFGYVYHMVGDRAWAEDIAQEAFIQAHQYLNRLGPPYDFKSWVYRIAGNMALDGLRRSRHEVPLPDWDGGEASGPEPADQHRTGAPEDQARLAEVRAAVWHIIHQLPDNYRQILVLREIDGLSYNEIAAVVGLSLDNVRVTLHRARLQFRDLYELHVMVQEGRLACQELDDLLSAYVDDELDRSARRRVRAHIKVCPACQKKRRDLLAVGGLLAALAPVFPPLTLHARFLNRLQHLSPPEPAIGTEPASAGMGNQPAAKGGGGFGGGSGPWLLAAAGGGFAILLFIGIILGGLLILPRMGSLIPPNNTPAIGATDTPAVPPTSPDTSTPLPPLPTSTARPTLTPTLVRPTSTPAPTYTPLPTRTPTLSPTPTPLIEFWADDTAIPAGTCTTVYWKTEHVQAVFFNGVGVPGTGSHQTCPCEDETHVLDVILPDGSHDVRQIDIQVTGSCITPTPDVQGPSAPTSLTPSEDVVFSCRGTVTLSWSAAKDPSGVAGYYVRLESQVSRDTWEPVGSWGPLSGTQTTVPVSCGLGYRWTVRARDGAGNLGPWSSWATFGIGID